MKDYPDLYQPERGYQSRQVRVGRVLGQREFVPGHLVSDCPWICAPTKEGRLGFGNEGIVQLASDLDDLVPAALVMAAALVAPRRPAICDERAVSGAQRYRDPEVVSARKAPKQAVLPSQHHRRHVQRLQDYILDKPSRPLPPRQVLRRAAKPERRQHCL